MVTAQADHEQWWQAIMTVRSMLVKRGYREVDMRLQSKAALLSELVQPCTDPLLVGIGRQNVRRALGGEARVFFNVSEDKVSIRSIRTLQEQWPACLLILVALSGSTPFVKKEQIQVFQLSEMTTDLTTHELVPTHTVIGEREVVRIFDGDKTGANGETGANKAEKGGGGDGREAAAKMAMALPQIPTTDAVARFLDLRVGEVVRIRRSSRGGGLPGAIYYRRVC